MNLQKIDIPAGGSIRHDSTGSVFILYDTGSAPHVNVHLLVNGSVRGNLPEVKRGLKVSMPFTGIEIFNPGTVAATVKFIAILSGDGDVGFTDNLILGHTPDNPVPVHFESATLAVDTVTVKQASVISNADQVNVTAWGGAFLGQNNSRRGFRILNSGSNPVAIGGAGITYASAVLIVEPGEIYFENEASCAAWYAATESGKVSVLKIQELLQ